MNTYIVSLSAVLFMFLSFDGLYSNLIAPGDANIVIAPVRTIVINSDDQMRFDKSEIRVKAGEKIKLTLNHAGKLPKNAIGHNLVLLAKGTDMANFAQAAMNARATEYIPANGVLAHTKLIGGGESITIEFRALQKEVMALCAVFPVIMR